MMTKASRARAWKTVRYFVAGCYFDLFVRRYAFRGLVFEVPRRLTDRVFRGRFVLGGYESVEEYDYVERYLPRDARVLELGGCLGVMSCFINRRLENPAHHVVLEANPALIPFLTRNRDRNGCAFRIVNGVLSRRQVEVFFVHRLIVGGSNKRQTSHRIEVPGLALEELARASGGGFDAFVIDIEGGELELLREMGDVFRGVRTVLIELHPFKDMLTPAESAECERRLDALGFEKKEMSANGHQQVWVARTNH